MSVSIKVSKEQCLAPGGFEVGQPAPGLMGLGKLGYPGSKVIWQYDEPCPLITRTQVFVTQSGSRAQDSSLQDTDCSQSFKVPPEQAQGGKIHGGQLNLSPHCAVWELRTSLLESRVTRTFTGGLWNLGGQPETPVDLILSHGAGCQLCIRLYNPRECKL